MFTTPVFSVGFIEFQPNFIWHTDSA